MATIGNTSFNAAQIKHQARVNADAKTVDSHEATQAVQTGASSQLSEKAKNTKTKGPGESLDAGLAARLKAAEAEAASDVQAEARQNVADEAAVQNKTNRKELGDQDKDHRVGKGDIKGQKDGFRVFQLDEDSAESYEVSEADGRKLDSIDGRTPEQILAGMPEGSRKAAEATLNTQVKTKGTEKVSELKDDPKVSAVAEQLDLDPAESLRESAVVAPIRDAKNEPPMMQEDPLLRETALRGVNGKAAEEAMIA